MPTQPVQHMTLVPEPQPVSDESLIDLIDEIDQIKPIISQGLLRETELVDIMRRASDAYNYTIDHDTIQYRKYDKFRRNCPYWREVRVSGYVEEKDCIELFDLRQQIIELLDLHFVDSSSTEIFLSPNSQYTARYSMRNILSTAEKSIFIKDDYLFSANNNSKNIDILWLLQPYLSTSLKIKCKLLGSSDDIPKSIVSDLVTFLKQNQEVEIKGYSKSRSGNRETHDRFIIIDETNVYKIGASLKDIGLSQSSIDKVNDENVLKEYVACFNGWWKNARSYDI